MSDSLWPYGVQHARLPCPSPTPAAYSNSCPSSWWCHPPISCLIREAYLEVFHPGVESRGHAIVVVQLPSRVQLFATQWTAARQASLSLTISWSLLKFMAVELVLLCNHLILCLPLLLPSIFSRIRVFSNEMALHIRWPKYWSFSISPSNEYWVDFI